MASFEEVGPREVLNELFSRFWLASFQLKTAYVSSRCPRLRRKSLAVLRTGLQQLGKLTMISSLCSGNAHAHIQTWKDPSPHKVSMITVQPKLEVEMLDWGGSGRPLILIAGIGSTAHAFDDFAPLLTPHFHVYAITRRGYGTSSRPPSGYGVDRLGDDVVAVIHALDLGRPILMGHSFGGQELREKGE